MAISYRMEITVEPEVIRRGTRVMLKVHLHDFEGDFLYGAAEVVGYGMKQRLRQLEDNLYYTTVDIPAFAPLGNYQMMVYAVAQDRSRGPVEMIHVTVQ